VQAMSLVTVFIPVSSSYRARLHSVLRW
jgi:hypothetical protein